MKRRINKERKGTLKHTRLISWLFCIPGGLMTLLFGWYPLVWGFLIAFQDYNIIGPTKYTGLTNFKDIFADPVFLISLKNVFYYTFLNLALTFVLPIVAAILLMEMKKRTIRLMMWLWFIPTASMAGITLWKWCYNPQYGLFNGILIKLGLPTLQWLNDPKIAMLCLVLPSLILFAPGLIYIAGVQGIPTELYEAAELEGAGLWRKIWSITLPRIRPIISMMLILGIISNMQVFTQPYVLTAGGPGTSTISTVMYFYEMTFSGLEFGKGTATAFVLFFILIALIILQRKYLKENLDQ